jgi:hypothetical protein
MLTLCEVEVYENSESKFKGRLFMARRKICNAITVTSFADKLHVSAECDQQFSYKELSDEK